MESKQPLRHAQDANTSPARTANEISGHLADIELKLDHIIESIKDSLHSQNLEVSNREDAL